MNTKLSPSFALSALLLVPPLAPAAEKEAVLWEKMKARIQTVEQRLDGVVGVSLKDLAGGREFELRPAEPFPTASSIKLAVLYELYQQAEEGKGALEEVTRPGPTRVGGGGILQELGHSVSLSWRDLAVLMMGWSDNEATNLLIDKVGLEAVNRRLDSLGLPATRLRRKMMDLEAARLGRENVSTPGELRRLAEAVYQGPSLSPPRAKDMRALAALPKDSPFRLALPESVPVLDKPGALEGIRCVGAVVALPKRPYSVAIMTAYLKRDEDGDQAIREISAILYDTFDRLARSSELGRVISEK